MRSGWVSVVIAAAVVSVLAGVDTRVARADRIDRLNAARFTDVDVDPETGKVAVTGWRSAGDHENAIVRVYGPKGTLLWSRKWVPPVSPLFGARGDGFSEAVSFGPHGTVYIGGAVAAACEGGGWFIRAYGRRGALRWQRQQAGWKECQVATKVTTLDADADRVIVGMQDFGCCGTPDRDGWLSAFSHDGESLWTDPFEPTGIPTSANDQLKDLTIGEFGRIYAVGAAYRRAFDDAPEAPDADVFVQKLAPSGAVIWTRVFPDGWPPDYDTASSVSVRGDRVMVVGLMELAGWARPATWLGRFTVGGQLRWSKRIATKSWSEPRVSVAPGGATYLTAGWRDSDAVARKYGRTATILWQRIFGLGTGADVYATGVAARPAGGAWLTIRTFSLSSASDRSYSELYLLRR